MPILKVDGRNGNFTGLEPQKPMGKNAGFFSPGIMGKISPKNEGCEFPW